MPASARRLLCWSTPGVRCIRRAGALAAILDALEASDDVLASGQGDAIIAERTAAIIARLAEVDDAARKIAAAEAAAAPGQAWAAVFVDTVEYVLA